MPRVLITPATLAGVQAPFLDVLKNNDFTLVYPNVGAQLNEDQILHHLAGIDACLAGSEPYTDRVLAAHPQLRIIARVGVGYDAVDVAAATKRGVAVTITPGTNQGSVAEHAFSLMLALARRIVSQHIGTAAGKWPRGTTVPMRGQVLGIAGLGRIGRAIATRALAFEMKVIAFDPLASPEWAEQHGIELVSFDELMQRSDYVTLHMPALPSTRHLVNARTLALMKPTAYLINTARGSVVDEPALVEALQNRKIAGAGLDVFEEEPPPVDHPLLKLDNVVLTPHAAGTDFRSRDDMAYSAAEAIVDLFRGVWPAEKIVNPDFKQCLPK